MSCRLSCEYIQVQFSGQTADSIYEWQATRRQGYDSFFYSVRQRSKLYLAQKTRISYDKISKKGFYLKQRLETSALEKLPNHLGVVDALRFLVGNKETTLFGLARFDIPILRGNHNHWLQWKFHLHGCVATSDLNAGEHSPISKGRLTTSFLLYK